MPIFEFYCRRCHRVMSFLARSSHAPRQPDCPHCGLEGLPRRPSRFAALSGRMAEPGESLPGDETRLASAMASLEQRAASIDEEDASGAAGLLRRFTEDAGLPLGDAMREALHRMESGEDPQAVEAELAEGLDLDDLGAAGEPGPLGAARRRAVPPTVDDELYEL